MASCAVDMQGMARVWKPFRALGLASAAFLTAAVIAAAPVQAGDVLACIEAVAPLQEGKDAAEAAAKAAQCVGQASGDPVMATTIASLAALYAGGAFSSTDECMGVIDSMVGKMLATALVQSGLADAFGDDAKKKLEDLANGVASQTFTEVVNSVPALQVLLMYVTCGCQVAGLPGTYEQIANQYKQSVAQCADFASDAVAFVGDAVESGIDAVGEGIKKVIEFAEKCVEDPTSVCGLLDDDDGSQCVTHVFPKEKFGSLVPQDIKDSVFMGTCGVWVCAEGGHPQTHVVQGKTLNTCSYCYGTWALDSTGKCAPCGGTIQKKISTGHTWTIGAGPRCLTVVTGYPTNDGAHCNSTESLSCCAPGQQMKPAGWNGEVNCDPQKTAIGGPCTNVEQATAQCQRACPGSEYFDPATNSCSKCNFDSVPVYASADSSIAECKQCAPGLNGFGKECQPCGPGEVIWSLSPPNRQQKQDGPMTVAAPAKKQDGRDTRKQAGPIVGEPKPGLPPDASVRPLPPGPHPDTMTALPGGPIGGLVNGGRCTACPENWLPVYYSDPLKNSLGYCKECDPGTYLEVPKLSQVPPKGPDDNWLYTPKQPEPKCVPLNCPAGLDPNNPHACRPPLPTDVAKPVVPVPGGGPGAVAVPGGVGPRVGVVPDGPAHRLCPPGMRPVGGACVPPASTVVPKRALTCPPGQLPNAARTACVRISRVQPGDRILPKTPSGPVANPAKGRLPQWLAKRRPGPAKSPSPIPIPR